MLGRSKPLTKWRAWVSPRRSAISARGASSAVAVSAMRGTSGKRSCSAESWQVLGPEVVAPLRDAVRLVDGEQRDAAAPEQFQRALGEQPLGGDVEQVELACEQGARPRGRCAHRAWS
jgi:hypothetical protein